MWQMKNNLKKIIDHYKNKGYDLDKKLKEVQENCTIAAIDKATELTPPDMDMNNGTGTITGTLKSAWASDSIKEAYVKNGRYITELKNNCYYASYVNDGHRMDKHFVPGLMINPYSGLLEKAPEGMNTGIMVGTKTKYVPGKYMKEGAIDEYEKRLKIQLDDIIEEIKNV